MKNINKITHIRYRYDALENKLNETEIRVRNKNEIKEKLGPDARVLIIQR